MRRSGLVRRTRNGSVGCRMKGRHYLHLSSADLTTTTTSRQPQYAARREEGTKRRGHQFEVYRAHPCHSTYFWHRGLGYKREHELWGAAVKKEARRLAGLCLYFCVALGGRHCGTPGRHVPALFCWSWRLLAAVVDDAGDLAAEVVAADDLVDEAFFLEELGGLEAFGGVRRGGWCWR